MAVLIAGLALGVTAAPAAAQQRPSFLRDDFPFKRPMNSVRSDTAQSVRYFPVSCPSGQALRIINPGTQANNFTDASAICDTVVGAQGQTGATGPQGPQGPPGPQGPVGPKGPGGGSSCMPNVINASIACPSGGMGTQTVTVAADCTTTSTNNCASGSTGTWVAGAWGACSGSPGTQTRSYSCSGGTCSTPRPADDTASCCANGGTLPSCSACTPNWQVTVAAAGPTYYRYRWFQDDTACGTADPMAYPDPSACTDNGTPSPYCYCPPTGPRQTGVCDASDTSCYGFGNPCSAFGMAMEFQTSVIARWDIQSDGCGNTRYGPSYSQLATARTWCCVNPGGPSSGNDCPG